MVPICYRLSAAKRDDTPLAAGYASLAVTLSIAILAVLPTRVVAQEDALAYRSALARAVRQSAQQVLPSVVSIEVIGVAETTGRRQQASEVEQDAPSCGVVVDSSGYIVASEIIMRQPSASLIVVVPDGTRLAATVVARDHHRGLVMLKVTPKAPLKPLPLIDQVSLPVGSTVVAVGRYGSDGSPMVSSGILSATGRIEGTMLQCDARVSPTFYGGPLVDLYGNALGILVPAVAPGGAPDDTSWYDSGIAFAVPTPVLKNKLARLQDGTSIRKGLIGIVPQSKDPYAENTELAAVRNRSPAEKAGILPGDQVVSIAGKPVRMFQQIKQALGPYDAGETIEIKIIRDGKEKTFRIELTDSIPPLQPQRLGVWLVEEQATSTDDASDGSDESSNPLQVIVRAIVPQTPADGKLQRDDVIEKIGNTVINDIATAARTMITAIPDTPVEVTVQRADKPIRVSVTPASISGPLLEQTIEEWSKTDSSDKWNPQDLRLPDVPNLASYVGPGADAEDDVSGPGMLMLLLPPDQRDPEEVVRGWQEFAARQGVVVCAICSEDENRWQPKEIDVVSRMATMLAQRVPVAVTAVAAPGVLRGVSASAADSMVIAIALSDRKNFAGVAVSDESKPPAVRLRENEPDRSLQILMPIGSIDDGPAWLAPLVSSGYPIATGEDIEPSDLLRWVRLLQTI